MTPNTAESSAISGAAPRPRGRPRSPALPLLLGAVFCAHLLVAWASRNGAILDDADSYVRLGANLAAGHGYVFEPGGAPTSWRAPGYPLFLAAVFALAGGPSPGAARFAHALLWTLSALLTYHLARRTTGGTPSALLAAAVVGFYPELSGLTGLLWSESLFICLFLAALLATHPDPGREPRPGRWAARAALAGLLIAAATLTRSTAIVLVPALWLAGDLRGQGGGGAPRSARRAAAAAAVASAVALICVGAWTARNALVHRSFILVESNAGYNLFLGNRPETPLPFAWRSMDTVREDPAYRRLVAGRSEAQQNRALSRAALDQITASPVRFLGLAAGKTFDFWLPDYFIAANVRSGAFGDAYRSAWPSVLLVTGLAYLVVAAAAARYVVRRRGRRARVRLLVLTLVLYTLPHAVVLGASRYHLPLVPLLAVLAAPEILARTTRSRRPRRPMHARAPHGT